MSPETVKRKLAAILSADAVGYSRLMAQDEAATLKTLNAHRGLMGGLIRQHGGRVVDAVGDNLLAEFPSVVDAVACAVAVQGALAERNADLPTDGQMPFRIGLHLGDVMVEGEQVYGDGVNIAARLEALADAGGICVSATVHEQIRDKLSHRYEDLGEQSLKNIAHPVRVYRVRLAEGEKADHTDKLTVPGFGGRPAIAVLAFDNLSGDPEQEYFADGIAEDLITRLSAFRSCPVIARNSSFTYKRQAVDVKQVGRELGARYVVEGSVRRAGDRVRVSAQLIDAETGHHLWADRYDRDLDDIFALQDELTAMIIGSLRPAVEREDRNRAMRQAPHSLGPWDRCLRGLWHAYRETKDDNEKARSYFRSAIELDPGSAIAYVGLTITYVNDLAFDWSESHEESRAQGNETALRAVAVGPENALAHVANGWMCSAMQDYDSAITAHERAISLNPSLTAAYHGLGAALARVGRPDDGVRMLEKAIRLSPHDPAMHDFEYARGVALFFGERYEEAVACARRSLQLKPEQPSPYRLLAASFGYLGRMDEARAALDAAFRIRPDVSVHGLMSRSPLLFDRLVEGWRKAGWKEDETG